MAYMNDNYINSISNDLYYIQDNARTGREILNELDEDTLTNFLKTDNDLYLQLKDLSTMTSEIRIKAKDILNRIQIVKNMYLIDKLEEENKKIMDIQKTPEYNKKLITI